MALASDPPKRDARKRADMSDAFLVGALAMAALVLVIYYAAWPSLPPAWHAPGSPVLQSSAIIGSCLLLMPLAFAVAKRGGRAASPPRWFAAHVLASIVGFVLVAIHTAGRMGRPPFLMLVALAFLALSGALARLWLSRQMAATLGTKRSPFRGVDPDVQARLRGLIQRKIELLKALDPSAREATFSVTLAHILRSPRRALAYLRLAREESQLLGARQSVGSLQAWWRPLHIAIGYLFLAGLLTHVVVVTFFAGYVADGRQIYWWHLATW
ncbi:MAG: hypothetical protein AB7E70_20880 [Hyphomicrobiaceae bacterium]